MYRSSLRGREGDGNDEAMAVARSDLAWSDELASSVRLCDRSIDRSVDELSVTDRALLIICRWMDGWQQERVLLSWSG
jgi:hypothetical protein